MFSREGFREYASGALWVWPSIASIAALITGSVMGQIIISPRSPLAPLAFQGTADDARSLLTTISSTVVTVIALVLGLTVVALQLASTQFSPRLLRNFLRDRSTQVVLSVFMATFVYSTAGLFTVGVSRGSRTEEYPRLAVTIAMVLLFASLAMVVYFADHLAHSIQIDAVTTRAELGALKVADGDCLAQVRNRHLSLRRGRSHCPRCAPDTSRPRIRRRCCRWPASTACRWCCAIGSVST
jgi:uncharacterized membrane protein